jgi:hypothetical protein
MSARLAYDSSTQLAELHITGAGLRPTPVRFFTAEETEQARAWLLV